MARLELYFIKSRSRTIHFMLRHALCYNIQKHRDKNQYSDTRSILQYSYTSGTDNWDTHIHKNNIEPDMSRRKYHTDS